VLFRSIIVKGKVRVDATTYLYTHPMDTFELIEICGNAKPMNNYSSIPLTQGPAEEAAILSYKYSESIVKLPTPFEWTSEKLQKGGFYTLDLVIDSESLVSVGQNIKKDNVIYPNVLDSLYFADKTIYCAPGALQDKENNAILVSYPDAAPVIRNSTDTLMVEKYIVEYPSLSEYPGNYNKPGGNYSGLAVLGIELYYLSKSPKNLVSVKGHPRMLTPSSLLPPAFVEIEWTQPSDADSSLYNFMTGQDGVRLSNHCDLLPPPFEAMQRKIAMQYAKDFDLTEPGKYYCPSSPPKVVVGGFSRLNSVGDASSAFMQIPYRRPINFAYSFPEFYAYENLTTTYRLVFKGVAAVATHLDIDLADLNSISTELLIQSVSTESYLNSVTTNAMNHPK